MRQIHQYSLAMGTMWICTLALFGCGSQPTRLASRLDVEVAPADTEMLDIGNLPIQEYPRLSRFRKAWRIDFYTVQGSGADDEKLKAFSKVKLPSLNLVILRACSKVTDQGIRWLSRMKVESLDLSGTSISDASLELLASQPRLKRLDIRDCDGITWKGILALVASSGLQGLQMSLRSKDERDVGELIRTANPHLKHLEIDDQGGALLKREMTVIIQRENGGDR